MLTLLHPSWLAMTRRGSSVSAHNQAELDRLNGHPGHLAHPLSTVGTAPRCRGVITFYPPDITTSEGETHAGFTQ
ncbi:hypothetical protein PSEUDO8AS_10439 [Pseudomonas sp. 8AS]|nr:hypothetical protein PSEUDO8AS_10439 [Pseudomonas sp. 8AS]